MRNGCLVEVGPGWKPSRDPVAAFHCSCKVYGQQQASLSRICCKRSHQTHMPKQAPTLHNPYQYALDHRADLQRWLEGGLYSVRSKGTSVQLVGCTFGIPLDLQLGRSPLVSSTGGKHKRGRKRAALKKGSRVFAAAAGLVTKHGRRFPPPETSSRFRSIRP